MRRLIIGVVVGAVLTGGVAGATTHWIITSTKQIKPSVLRQLHGARGARGRTGALGPQGRPGTPGVANLDQNETGVSVPPASGVSETTATVQCPKQGDKPLSGFYNAPTDLFIETMMPLASDNGFTFSIFNGYGQTETVTIGVICAQVG